MELDRLPDTIASIEVVYMDEAAVGTAAERGPRTPHRHDYHELIWMREGEAHHVVDGRPFEAGPGTVTAIARGQVHVFESAREFTGVIVRFGGELLDEGPPALEPTVVVPEADVDRLEAILDMLSAEVVGRPDHRRIAVQRHLLSSLVLWLERWQHAAAREDEASDAAVQLHRRFAALLERDFAQHHDAGHYADALGVPQAALSRALAEVMGHTTKELILDRVMLEAARLLRYSDRSVSQVAFETGFDDQLYFSRAFKRSYGESPTAYRERLRAS